MNMKKKFLTVAVAAAALCGSILPLAAENMMTAEALTAETQSPVFVEVLPAEEPEQLPEEPVQADPEPADTDPAEPADPADSAQPADTCREAMAAYITGVNESVTKADALTMADAMVKQAEAYDLDEKLLLAMAHTESTYYSDAVSSADCKGLMQTADVLAEEAGYSPEALFDPEISIAVGAGYINDQLDAFDQDVVLALTAYNQGPGTVYSGNYDTGYAEVTLERVETIENFLSAGGFAQE